MLLTNTYTGKRLVPLYPVPGVSPKQPIKLVAGTYVMGQLVEESATPGTYQALTAAANSRLVLEYDVVVNAGGEHFLGIQAASETGVGDLHTSAYAPVGGLQFDTRDLCIDNARTALTQPHIDALNAKLFAGTPAAGIIGF